MNDTGRLYKSVLWFGLMLLAPIGLWVIMLGVGGIYNALRCCF